MTIFCAVNDARLVSLIRAATDRIILIAPGLHQPVAEALVSRFNERAPLQVTLVLDASEDVCRIGFGEIGALEHAHSMANRAGFAIRTQAGLRIGILIVDETTLVWAPTPRSVEATPGLADAADEMTPNGLLLDADVGQQIASAAAADGTETTPEQAEIGHRAVTPAVVAEVTQALTDNPPIPVDLQRITRVFSSKLQFVELKVKGARLAERRLSIPSKLINADADALLRDLMTSSVRAFAEFKDEPIEVPAFLNGEQVFNREGKAITEQASAAKLERERAELEREFLYSIVGFGALMEREKRGAFEKRLDTYKTRLEAHAKGLRALIAAKEDEVIKQAVALIMRRAGLEDGKSIDPELLAEKLKASWQSIADEMPVVQLVYKDVTYEQTRDEDFHAKLDRVLPLHVKRRLGDVFNEFQAAKAARG